MDKREALIRRIKDTLAIYAVRIDLDKGEASRAAENFYCGLLNILKGYQLQNMNLVKPNYPAIDLGDAGEGLGVQVTSTATREKVQHTLDAMFRNGVEQEYPHLVMLITKEWRDFRKAFRMDGVCQFDPNADIWDTNWLLEQLDGIVDLEKLEAIRDYLKRHLHLVREPVPAMNLPLQSGMAAKNFVGREEELRELAQRFEKDQIVVLSGLGGMGKTELAVRFGREYEESGRGWAYFLHFSGSFSATVRSNVTGIIPGYSPEGKPEERIVADALAALNRCGKEDLLILDNADEGSITALRRELSKLPMRVLVTSRQESDDMMELGTLSEEALFGLFRRHGAELEEADMRALIKAVDGHTMTVELMARLLHKDQRKDTLSRLKKALGERDLSSGEFGKTESTYHASPDQARINEHLKAVFRVSDMGRAEKTVLRFATLIGESGLDSEMFAKVAEWKKKRWRLRDLFRGKQVKLTSSQVRDTLQELADKGWLLRKKGDIKIHPVIRIVCVEVLKPTEESCEEFLFGIKNQYDRKQYDHAKFRQMAEVFETASNLLEDKTGFWANKAGYLWGEVAETQRALACNLRSVEKNEQHQPDSNNLAASYNNVGVTYFDLGDHKQALEYQMIALGIRERVLPPEHPDLARSYNNVGSTYGALGDHKQALEYRLKALDIRERVLLPEHPDLAISYGNVGSAYRALGEPQKALEYELKVISIFEKVLPKDHPHLATSYKNVGSTYGALGDHKQALEYQMKALGIRERVLPPEHPSLATSYNNVGMTYGALGDHKQALEYQLKDLAICERVLPPEHPDLAQSFNNIAWIYYALGRIGEAATHMRRAAEIINRSALPETHPNRVNYNKWAEEMEAKARQEETV